MVDTSKYFESDSPYEKAADHRETNEVMQIEEAGSDVLTTRDGDDRAVIWVKLSELEKPIVLSNTNGRILRNAFGKKTGKWIGRNVLLTTKDYNFDGNATVGWITNPMPDSKKKTND